MMQLLLIRFLKTFSKAGMPYMRLPYIIKSDNALGEYKNKTASFPLRDIANIYDAKFIQIYGAESQRKELIDAMSSFGAKSVLLPDIAIMNMGFPNNREISNHLNFHRDQLMNYSHVDADDVDSKHASKGK